MLPESPVLFAVPIAVGLLVAAGVFVLARRRSMERPSAWAAFTLLWVVFATGIYVPGLPAPAIAFGTLGLVAAPLVLVDAHRRDGDWPFAWAIGTLLTFGHGGLLYLLDRNDPGERPEQDGEFMLPGTDPPGDNGDTEE